MSQIEIIVSGHSSDEDSKIKLPKNVEVMFYAQPKETCYLPDDIDSLNGIIQSMKNRDGDLVKRERRSIIITSNFMETIGKVYLT